MANVTEFLSAVKQISIERGIPENKVMQALQEAILTAYKKDYNKEHMDNLVVELDGNTGNFRLLAQKTVVKKVNDPESEIGIIDANKMVKGVGVGDMLEVEISGVDFGRLAAQTGRQIIMQKISEYERDSILEEFEGKVGTIFPALMQRFVKGVAIFEIGKATAFMDSDDQVPGEFYKAGQKYRVLLKSILDESGSKRLTVSRADVDFLIGIFQMEVPEIDSGAVEIVTVVRESGIRSKVVVRSNEDGIDAVGACIGQKGSRISAIMSELGIEKIDVLEWTDDLETLVRRALAPAKINSVDIKNGKANVTVDADQLSLAIGKDGQSARLASKLTGLDIAVEALPEGKIESTYTENETVHKETKSSEK